MNDLRTATAALSDGTLVASGQIVNGLLVDLSSAEETLRKLESILAVIEGHQSLPGAASIPLHTSAKARWAIHRASLSKLQSRLSDIQQRIMARLQIMNV